MGPVLSNLSPIVPDSVRTFCFLAVCTPVQWNLLFLSSMDGVRPLNRRLCQPRILLLRCNVSPQNPLSANLRPILAVSSRSLTADIALLILHTPVCLPLPLLSVFPFDCVLFGFHGGGDFFSYPYLRYLRKSPSTHWNSYGFYRGRKGSRKQTRMTGNRTCHHLDYADPSTPPSVASKSV